MNQDWLLTTRLGQAIRIERRPPELWLDRWHSRVTASVNRAARSAENAFKSLKRERKSPMTYPMRHYARRGVFEYIAPFFNPKRMRTNNAALAPGDFETGQPKIKRAGVQES